MKFFKPFTPPYDKKDIWWDYWYNTMKELAEINWETVDLKEKYGKEDFEAGNFTEEDWDKLRGARKQGKKVLVIDEVQSKRHQEGREKGYIDQARLDEIVKK